MDNTGGYLVPVMADTDEDPWTLFDGSEIRLAMFNPRSTNSHDHAVEVRVRYPGEYKTHLDFAVASDKTPWRTLPDLLRNGMYLALALSLPYTKDENAKVYLENETRLAHVEAVKHERESMEALVVSLTQELQESGLDNHALDAAIELAEHYADEIRAPYNEQLRTLIKRYGG